MPKVTVDEGWGHWIVRVNGVFVARYSAFFFPSRQRAKAYELAHRIAKALERGA
jgi:hypothetical protein